MPARDYLFDSNYPYFEALHLGRFIRWLAKIECALALSLNPTQQVCHLAYHAGDVVFKDQLFDPGVSPEEFARREVEKSRFDALSERERERELEEAVAGLREEEFDDADDSWFKPVKDRDRVMEFVRVSRSLLGPLARFAVPGDSLVEDIVAFYVRCPRMRTPLRGVYGLLASWDLMRMRHEGRSPYSISFAPSFAESFEKVLKEEGEVDPDVTQLLEDWSRPRPYTMNPRDFTLARAGVVRAGEAEIISATVARALLERLDEWEKDDR